MNLIVVIENIYKISDRSWIAIHWLSLSQIPLHESAHRHHPPTAWQPPPAHYFVRWASHRRTPSIATCITSGMRACMPIDYLDRYYVSWCALPLLGTLPPIISLAPSLLNLAISLSCKDCTHTITSFCSTIFMLSAACIFLVACTFHHRMFSFFGCCSLSHTYRYLQTNQLIGTIPPQLGNLAQLQGLYLHNRIVIIYTMDELVTLNPFIIASLSFPLWMSLMSLSIPT